MNMFLKSLDQRLRRWSEEKSPQMWRQEYHCCHTGAIQMIRTRHFLALFCPPLPPKRTFLTSSGSTGNLEKIWPFLAYFRLLLGDTGTDPSPRCDVTFFICKNTLWHFGWPPPSPLFFGDTVVTHPPRMSRIIWMSSYLVWKLSFIGRLSSYDLAALASLSDFEILLMSSLIVLNEICTYNNW